MTSSRMLKLLKEYSATIIVTIIVLFSLCLCVELELMFRCEDRVNRDEFALKNLEKFSTIEFLERRLKNEPKNYVLDIRLALVYESLKDFPKANKYYTDALKISNRSNVALYYYALFCAKQNLFATSARLCEEIVGNDKKALNYKAKIYEEIGDSLTRQKRYEGAIRAFQISYKYARSLKDKKFLNSIKDKFAHSYIFYADECISQKDTDSAIMNLNNSLKIKETLNAKYKLALIYLNIDKTKAQRIMSEVFRINPYIVNPYIYNSLLEDLIKISKENNDITALKYYSLKLDRFKKKLGSIYVYKNEFLIYNTDIRLSRGIFSLNKKYFLVFDIKNNTKQNIDELYLNVELFVNSKKYSIDKKIFTKANKLEPYAQIDNIKIEVPSEIDFKSPENKITVKYFTKKKINAPWTLIKIDSINF